MNKNESRSPALVFKKGVATIKKACRPRTPRSHQVSRSDRCRIHCSGHRPQAQLKTHGTVSWSRRTSKEPHPLTVNRAGIRASLRSSEPRHRHLNKSSRGRREKTAPSIITTMVLAVPMATCRPQQLPQASRSHRLTRHRRTI